MIEIQRLNRYYEKGRSNEVHAVKNVNLNLPDHGIVAIFGKSGCGKTTLLNLVGGLDCADSGEVRIDGERITPDSDHARNLSVGYIFQNYNLIKDLTVYENVAAALRLCGVKDETVIRTRTIAALASVEMEKYEKRLPDSLSGGQQQRVAIARALVKNPRLILADEPTGNLDEQNTLLVMNLLHEIARDHLVLLVTHEAHLVDLYCDLVIEVSDGAVVGTHQNEVTDGFLGKSKTDVYLGDLPKSEGTCGAFEVECYGDLPTDSAKIRLISIGNTVYLQAPPEWKLRVLDQSAEIKVHEGNFTKKASAPTRPVDPVLQQSFATPKKAGRLFFFWRTFLSGICQTFAKKRKASEQLFRCGLAVFALVLTVLSAYFSHSISDYIDVTERFDDQTVYIRASALGDLATLQDWMQRGKVDSVGVVSASVYLSQEDNYISVSDPVTWRFCIGNFESVNDTALSFEGKAATFHLDAAKDRVLLCGKKTDLAPREMVISSGFAKKLLEQTTMDHLQTAEDLLYTAGAHNRRSGEDDRFTVVGVVEEENACVYLCDTALSFLNFRTLGDAAMGVLTAAQAQEHALAPLSQGELYIRADAIQLDGKWVNGQDGETVKIGGKTYTVKAYLQNEPYHFEKYLTDQKAYTAYWSQKREEIEAEFLFMPNAFELYLQSLPNVSDDPAAHVIDFLYASDVFYWSLAHPKEDPQGFYDFMERMENEFSVWLQNQEMEYSFFFNQQGDAYRSLPVVMMCERDYVAASIDVALYPSQEENTLLQFSENKAIFLQLHAADLQGLESASASLSQSDRITPNDLLRYHKQEIAASLRFSAVMMTVLGALIALCLYFMMRANMMSDIRKIGIYRAIGVSKKNLCFYYFSQSVTVFVTGVLIGYAIAAGILWGVLSSMRSAASVFYFPHWLGLSVAALLFAITCLCGMIPIWGLLRKTPSQILAKYDI